MNLSVAAVARRLQRLRGAGIISRDVAVLDQAAVGRPLTVIVTVSVDSELVVDLDEIKERFRRCPEVQRCYYVTGDASFVLIINVADMQEYEALTRSLFFEGGNVRRFRTFVSMQTVKVSDSVRVV